MQTQDPLGDVTGIEILVPPEKVSGPKLALPGRALAPTPAGPVPAPTTEGLGSTSTPTGPVLTAVSPEEEAPEDQAMTKAATPRRSG